MIYFCCDENRRRLVLGHDTLNGIDFLEVLDQDAPAGSPPQRTLLVYFLKPVPDFTRDNVRIEGGERIRSVGVVWAFPAAGVSAAPDLTPAEQTFFAELPEQEKLLIVRTDSSGDFAPYRLRLVTSPIEESPPAGIDPRLAAVDFSFKVECPSDFDCRPRRDCPPEPARTPNINYLAKDYASFRQLMLDRLSVLVPQWTERNPADMGVALVELLAFVGDYLSYQQDAVGTEAYLGTARRRVSVRRHARLVDYVMHEGSNARTWVQFQVDADIGPALDGSPALPPGTPLLARIPDQPVVLTDGLPPGVRPRAVFETLDGAAELIAAHNEISFYTWGARECCLPAGATQAFLADDDANRLRLRTGDVLIFEERLGPRTGRDADADPKHRHAVRLTRVLPEAKLVEQPDGSVRREAGPLQTDPVTGEAYVEIRWSHDDALPLALCISARTDAEHGGDYVDDVSLALGNVLLADHGQTVRNEALGSVPQPHLFLVPQAAADRCLEAAREAVPPRFRPVLQNRPLTHAAPYDATASAAAALRTAMRNALPQVNLQDGTDEPWSPQRDLLNSSGDAREFVVELENDSQAVLRFGDGVHGARPESETQFTATYRVGNGVAGNVGADSLVHVVTSNTAIVRVRNPLPARGGSEPETIENVRQRAPTAFRRQQRAITAADYAEVTERHPGVQRAAGTFRWTGSWHTAFVTVDRLGGRPVDAQFERDVRRHLELFRRAGYDLEVDGPRFVALEILMQVCVDAEYFRSQVRRELLEVFSDRVLPDGRRGVFHPDNFTFGQPVYLSRLYAAAQAVPGVASVRFDVFRRLGTQDQTALDNGVLPLGRLEIARLDNDPSFRERGVFDLIVEGGK